MANDTYAAMVLNDEETYTGVAGCRIFALTEEQNQEAENGGEKQVFREARPVYTFAGDEVLALTPGEVDCIREALLYLEEHGDNKWKDWNGETVPKRKREKVLDSLAGKRLAG